eukprot:scaffold12226_cov129-Isochrysis_galbana.AAC.1
MDTGKEGEGMGVKTGGAALTCAGGAGEDRARTIPRAAGTWGCLLPGRSGDTACGQKCTVQARRPATGRARVALLGSTRILRRVGCGVYVANYGCGYRAMALY